MGCAFCDRLAAADLAAENELAAALPDTFPPTRGHTLVVPRRHQADYSALTADEQSASTWFTATRGDVDDSRGGIRWIIPAKARYWEGRDHVDC